MAQEDYAAPIDTYLRCFLGDVRDRDRLSRAMDGSDEGWHAALGLLPGRAARLGLTPDAKVPHVGFATVVAPSDSWLGGALGASPDFYFTHSFAVREIAGDPVVGTCAYDGGFVAAVERWPVVGAQFHPEKSQASGLRFLVEFLRRATDR